MKYEEKRSFMRVNVECDMTYRPVNSQEFFQARCVSLSGAGVSFTSSENNIREGSALEINIVPINTLTPGLVAFVEVVRVQALAAQGCEVAAVIKTIKG